MKTIQPLGDRVLVLETKNEVTTKTAGGLLLPETHHQNDVKTAKVIAVGPGLFTQNGKLIPMTVCKGDTVLVPPYGNGQTLKIDGDDYVLYRESDLLAITDKVSTQKQLLSENQLSLNFDN
jgi:chaperonin GroES